MRTAICAIVKNEQDNLLEWIAFHHLLGFDTVLVIDDGSTDRTRDVAFAASRHYDVRLTGLVERGDDRQRRAYERICHIHRGAFDWIAFLDTDEFLVPRCGTALPDLLAACHPCAGIALPWLMFGSSHHDAKPDGLVIERFQRRSEFLFDPNRHVKSIVRPDRVVRAFNPHAFELDGAYCLPDGRALQWAAPGVLARHPTDVPWMAHHYFTRSRAHWRDRMVRGQLGLFTRTWGDFDHYDRNEVVDHATVPFGPAVRAELERIAARPWSRPRNVA